MLKRPTLPRFVRFTLGAVWLVVCAAASAHSGPHATLAPPTPTKSSSIEHRVGDANATLRGHTAPLAAATLRATASPHIGEAPFCPGGDSCCCSTFKGAVPTQARVAYVLALVVPLFADSVPAPIAPTDSSAVVTAL